MPKLAGDTQQRRSEETVRRQNRDGCDDQRQACKRDQYDEYIAPDRREKVVRRDYRRDDPAIELKRREVDEVVLAVAGAGRLKLPGFAEVDEAHVVVRENRGYGT